METSQFFAAGLHILTYFLYPTPMRLFVAVSLPEEIKEKIGDVLRDLTGIARLAEADVKWVKLEQIHFTVKFLGDCAEDQIPLITRALESAIQGLSRFMVSLGGLGYFPEKGLLRIIWLGLLEGEASLKELANRVEASCEPLGFPKEDRIFNAHLTLGRVKSIRNVDKIRSLLDRQSKASVGAFTINSIALIRSVLSPAGPTYTLLQTLEW